LLPTLLQVTGLIAISLGIGFVFIPAGIIAGGVSAVLIGLALERGR
jgi:hypothetical protein